MIHKAKNRLLDSYTENHHIIPKCMGGLDAAKNLVALSPEEHFVAHQLLIKIYPNESKLIYAVHMMTVNSSNQFRNNKSYGWLRRKWSEIHKKRIPWNKGKKGLQIAWNKGIPQSEEHRRKNSESKKGRVVWNKGLKTGPMSEKAKQNMRKPKSEVHKQNISKGQIAAYKKRRI